MLLEIVSFFIGASVMILELSGMRIISPFFGGNFIIITSSIGVIMASLSIGYFIGGKISDKNNSAGKLSLIIFFAALYVLFTALTEFYFLKLFSQNINLNVYINSLVISIYLFTIPSVLMGIVSPYIIKTAIIQRDILPDNTGQIIGRFYAVSSIGAITGTFLCGFFLIVYFGLEAITFSLSLIMFISSLLCLLSKKKLLKNKRFKFLLSINILFIFICLFFSMYQKIFSYHFYKIFDNSIYSVTTPYQYLYVEKEEGYRNKENIILLKNTAPKIGYLAALSDNDEPENSILGYIKFFFKIFMKKEEKNNILILGNSSGTLLNAIISYADKNNLNDINIDAVEIDKYTTEIGKKFFKMPYNDKRVHIFHRDGRMFINRKAVEGNSKYDLIFSDMYFVGFSIPHYLITKEAFENCKKILNDNGIVMINIIGGNSGKYKNNMNQIYTNISSVFRNIKVYTPENRAFKQNIFNLVIVAWEDNNKDIQLILEAMKNEEFNNIKLKPIVFTDNFSPIERIYIEK